ncbi:MAG TPA: cyclic nucleotide-binding domain-containing protein [Spirochaetota bacterium]|jgi:anti-sigma regulatory factor (Ser/Thr protein kinase)|nr:MAG: DNA-binding transcriptional dual regulator Crp [Spirochaetes bacterium ADurb.Bin133]HNZ28239.1 cyclic nucleotide-binding domain-containing protein [Spirochaetota bacterium]HPY88236.1 cyclic nucleotide-binding domain-containing protein [Spirochaetota bacterium]HQB62395.1 cyclic nucleotide-binding domain-containing protein [Spirochaetota bacterium]
MGIQIGAVTAEDTLYKKILGTINNVCSKDKNLNDSVTLIHLKTTSQASDYINYEFPDFIIINLNEKSIDSVELLKEINSDPWFHSTGLIVITDRNDTDTLPEEFNKLNVLSNIDITEIDYMLSKILEIVLQNRQVAVQKNLSNIILDKRSGTFVIDNDPSMITSYVNIITSSLANEKYINSNKETALRIALTELIMNGIEHGNCEINFEEKSAFLNNGGDINELIKEKCKDPKINARKVTLDYIFTNEKLTFVVKDCGKGFNFKKRAYAPISEEDLWRQHGRGIYMTRMYVDSLTYNDIGNEATVVVKTDRDAKTAPLGFQSQKDIFVKPGDVISKQGDVSDCLYYIVTGVYNIFVNKKKVAELNPGDIFLGEMSFLLNSRRTADIVAKSEGHLIEIPKKDFMGIIKKYPHYGLFISKLLAKRLEKLNKNVY